MVEITKKQQYIAGAVVGGVLLLSLGFNLFHAIGAYKESIKAQGRLEGANLVIQQAISKVQMFGSLELKDQNGNVLMTLVPYTPPNQ